MTQRALAAVMADVRAGWDRLQTQRQQLAGARQRLRRQRAVLALLLGVIVAWAQALQARAAALDARETALCEREQQLAAREAALVCRVEAEAEATPIIQTADVTQATHEVAPAVTQVATSSNSKDAGQQALAEAVLSSRDATDAEAETGDALTPLPGTATPSPSVSVDPMRSAQTATPAATPLPLPRDWGAVDAILAALRRPLTPTSLLSAAPPVPVSSAVSPSIAAPPPSMAAHPPAQERAARIAAAPGTAANARTGAAPPPARAVGNWWGTHCWPFSPQWLASHIGHDPSALFRLRQALEQGRDEAQAHLSALIGVRWALGLLATAFSPEEATQLHRWEEQRAQAALGLVALDAWCAARRLRAAGARVQWPTRWEDPVIVVWLMSHRPHACLCAVCVATSAVRSVGGAVAADADMDSRTTYWDIADIAVWDLVSTAPPPRAYRYQLHRS